MEDKNKETKEEIEDKTKKESKDSQKIEKIGLSTNGTTSERKEQTEMPKGKEKETKPKEPGPAEVEGGGAKKSAKKGEKDSDFRYIVRIANTDIDGEKKVPLGFSQIKGLGRRMATFVADAAGIDRETKCGNLTDSQLEKINEILENLGKKAPSWMLNHRKDVDTGKNIHLISTEVEMRLRDDVNLLKMIRSYRGIRHESGLRVRGQRTRGNNRKGLALGVSKRREVSK